MTKKIVVTGIGATSPLGGTAPESWTALLAGESGISTIEHEWVAKHELSVTFAGQAKVRPEDVLPRQEVKRLDPSSQFALISAREAWTDAGLDDAGIDPDRVGVDYSTGIGGLWTLLDAWDTLKEKGPRRVLPMTIPMLMPNAASAAISMNLAARAYARTDVSACASSTEAIANAYDHLQKGYADVVIAGGTEAVVHPLPIAAFAAMQALSKRNDDPAKASRPYDTDRDGFVLGEGAGSIILETEEHALARGARIYAELAGGGVTSDSYHITAPDPEGAGAARAVYAALEQAGASVDDVMHINAHATSTPRSTPSPAAPASTPSSPAAESRATRTTSPRPTPRVPERLAPCTPPSAKPAPPPTTSRTSTPTRRARPSATSPSTRRSSPSSVSAFTPSRSLPPRRLQVTCSAVPVRSRRSSRFSRCTTAPRRRRST